jgi:hypothetical protein
VPGKRRGAPKKIQYPEIVLERAEQLRQIFQQEWHTLKPLLFGTQTPTTKEIADFLRQLPYSEFRGYCDDKDPSSYPPPLDYLSESHIPSIPSLIVIAMQDTYFPKKQDRSRVWALACYVAANGQVELRRAIAIFNKARRNRGVSADIQANPTNIPDEESSSYDDSYG